MKQFKQLNFDFQAFKDYVSANIGDFKFTYDKEHIRLEPKHSEYKFSISLYLEAGDIYCVAQNSLPDEYLKFKFNMVDFNYLISIYNRIISIGEKYHFYKHFNHSKNLGKIQDVLNLEQSYKGISVKVPYDVSASLSTGRGGVITGDIVVTKNYFMENDFSISEFVCIDFPTRVSDKISLGLMNKCGVQHVYLCLKNDDYDFYKEDDIYPLIDDVILTRYQQAVKKQLGIKNAPFDDEHLTLLQMIKI